MQTNKSSIAPPLWLLFILGGFPQFSETVYSPALPDIAQNLATSNHLVQWTLSIYFIGFALGVFAWGRLSDRTGRKPAMLTGILIYTVGSIFCWFASDIIYLLIARLIQGFGASSGSVLTQTIARESLHDQKRHQFFSAAGFVIAFSIALGPFLGGYITQWFDWRANFALLILIGISFTTLAYIYLPETLQTQHTQRKSIRHVFAILLKDRYVLGCIWLVAAVNGILFCYYAEGPFIFIDVLGLSTSQYGWLGSAIAIAALLGSLASKRLIHRFSTNYLIYFGCLVLLISSILFVITALIITHMTVGKALAAFLMMLPMMGVVIGGFGFIIPMTLSTALQQHQAVLGTAGALFGLSYYIVIAFLTWIMGMIHNGGLLPMPMYFLVLSMISTLVYFKLVYEK